eukprot:223245_1
MGGSDSKEKPLPMNSIINSQNPEWGTCYCGYIGSVTPSWNFTAVTNAQLLSSGLTQQTLTNEIKIINEKAQQFVSSKSNTCRYYWWIGFIISFIIVVGGLIIIFITNPSFWFVIFGLLGGSTLLIYLFNFGVLWYYLKIWNNCLLYIEEYVNTELNQKYNQQNISWIVRHYKRLHGCGRSSYKVKYIDIAVCPGKYKAPHFNKEQEETQKLI